MIRIGAAVSILFAGVSWMLGSGEPGPAAMLAALSGAAPLDDVAHYIVFDVRLPRVLAAWLAGGVLGVAGSVVQALFRNPLAEPGLIGISGGAAAAAAAVIALFGLQAGMPAMQFAALSGSLLAVSLVWWIGRYTRAYWQSPLLVGVALNSLAMAIIGLCIYTASDATFRSFSFWLMGSFADAQWAQLPWLVAAATVTLLVVIALSRPLDRMLLGEIEARTLGLRVQRIRLWGFVAVSVGVGAITALYGIIAFIGLVVPHWARLWVGPLHRRLLPMAFFLGAALGVLADALARSVLAPAEIPFGAITAILGAPVFLLLLMRERPQ